MISSILKFFGFSKNSTSNTKRPQSEVSNEAMSTSIKNFMNRPIYKNFTSGIIDKIPDDELLQSVFDNLIEKFPKDYTKEFQTVMTWNKSQQAIYVIWCLEAEVNNGGFNQFYANPSGQYADLAPDALKLVGASKFAELSEKANEIYNENHSEITEYQDGTLEGFSKSYKNNPLNQLDDEFYYLYKVEDLQNCQVNFIRNNKIDFID